MTIELGPEESLTIRLVDRGLLIDVFRDEEGGVWTVRAPMEVHVEDTTD